MSGKATYLKWMLISLMAALLLVVASKMSRAANEKVRRIRLAEVTSPVGAGLDADIAQSLFPEKPVGLYELVPMSALVVPTQMDAPADAGVEPDGGMADPNQSTLERATEAALAFELTEAARILRELADTALGSDTMAFHPDRVARYCLAAGAAAADAGEEDVAIAYFRSAIAVDIGIRPGRDMSPHAKRLFDAALRDGPARLSIPGEKALDEICRALDVQGIVWVTVGRESNFAVVSCKIFVRGGGSSELETRYHPLTASVAEATWISTERARLGQRISLRLFGPQKRVARREADQAPAAPEIEKPWYRRWWVYAAIGGVVAIGTATGLGIYFARRPEEAEVVVHY